MAAPIPNYVNNRPIMRDNEPVFQDFGFVTDIDANLAPATVSVNAGLALEVDWARNATVHLVCSGQCQVILHRWIPRAGGGAGAWGAGQALPDNTLVILDSAPVSYLLTDLSLGRVKFEIRNTGAVALVSARVYARFSR